MHNSELRNSIRSILLWAHGKSGWKLHAQRSTCRLVVEDDSVRHRVQYVPLSLSNLCPYKFLGKLHFDACDRYNGDSYNHELFVADHLWLLTYDTSAAMGSIISQFSM
jgi:hypothetical protein